MRKIEGRGFTVEYDQDLYNLQVISNERGILHVTFKIRESMINDFFEEPEKYKEIDIEVSE